jgi:hypothetical protein
MTTDTPRADLAPVEALRSLALACKCNVDAIVNTLIEDNWISPILADEWIKQVEQNESDADAVPSELGDITNDHVIRALRIFGRTKMTKDGSLESWINLGADRFEKAEAEVERLKKVIESL